MFRVQWDTDTRGVRLSTIKTDETLGITPRPVFFEELDLLKLNELGYSYQKCKEPLMWACNKQYYYNGELCFEVKGANIYDAPTVVFQDGKENLELLPVDVPEMLRRCENLMFIVENEAIDFIREQYVMYSSATKAVEKVKANQIDFIALKEKLEKQTKQEMAIVKQDCESFDIMPMINAKKQHKKNLFATKIDKFIASFSGGKDSQVVLDLCTRAIPPTEFDVMYSDTGYELANSISVYEQSKDYYTKLYPNLKFALTKNHAPVLSYWDKIGTPSDTHRWCCSVMKTAPLYRSLKIPGTNRQAKVLTFEGVRAEESTRRSEYERVGISVKHQNIINARPIFFWNSVEIFLYIFKYNLPLNKAYREGNARVGCIICPYSQPWDDMISSTLRKDNLKPFLERIEKQAKECGVIDIADFVKERKWKFRASGDYLKNDSSIIVKSVTPTLIAQIKNGKKNIETWLSTVGEYSISFQQNSFSGEIKFAKNIYNFKGKTDGKGNVDISLETNGDAQLIKYFRRALYKTTHCINCEVCEVECPTGALKVLPDIEIDKTICTHCHKCLDFHDMGCIAAKSLIETTTPNMQAKTGIDRYNTFGLREEWLTAYFNDIEHFWSNNGLGTKQVPAMKNWLKESGITDSKNNITELGKRLSKIYTEDKNLVWEIIWINLAYNSFVAKWFVAKINFNEPFSKALICELFQKDYSSVYGERTIKNAFDALFRTFKESPIGSLLTQCEPMGKQDAQRKPYESLSAVATAYSLYKFSEMKNTKNLRISDFYQGENECGIFREFGLSQKYFEKNLHTLNSNANRVIIADLNMGLEHITLREDLSSDEVFKVLTD